MKLGDLHRTTPEEALDKEMWRTAAAVAYCEQQLQALGADDLTGPVGELGVDAKTGLRHFPKEELNVWYRAWQGERAHFLKVAKACIDAGLDERRVRLAEREGQLVAGVIVGVLEACGIDPTATKVKKIVRDQLMQASDGQVQPALLEGKANVRS